MTWILLVLEMEAIFTMILLTNRMKVATMINVKLIRSVCWPFFRPDFICDKVGTTISLTLFPHLPLTHVIMARLAQSMIFTAVAWRAISMIDPIGVFIDTKWAALIGTWLAILGSNHCLLHRRARMEAWSIKWILTDDLQSRAESGRGLYLSRWESGRGLYHVVWSNIDRNALHLLKKVFAKWFYHCFLFSKFIHGLLD